ncbi:MAG: hypothetical protein QXF61_07935 [Nitrososphaeria archaeon]
MTHKKLELTLYYTICPICGKLLPSLFKYQLQQFIAGHINVHPKQVSENDFKIYEKKVSLKCES